MFRCNNCGGLSAPKVKVSKAVVERRDVDYKDAKGGFIAKGWEIVKELVLCKECRGLFA